MLQRLPAQTHLHQKKDWDNDNNGTCHWSTCCEKRGSRLDWSTEKEEEDMPLIVGTLNIRL